MLLLPLPPPSQAASFQGSPLELSYWIAHNLPLQVIREGGWRCLYVFVQGGNLQRFQYPFSCVSVPLLSAFPPPTMQPATRQLLLMCSCPAERLRLLLELLQRLDRLCCSACGTQLATTAEVLAMTTEGIGGTYVNSHG